MCHCDVWCVVMQMSAGTLFVVMECIVMEGEDDLTLEPGEVVELMRNTVADAPLLRVRTMDKFKQVGNVPFSYLRKKDTVRGLPMESEWQLLYSNVEAKAVCAHLKGVEKTLNHTGHRF